MGARVHISAILVLLAVSLAEAAGPMRYYPTGKDELTVWLDSQERITATKTSSGWDVIPPEAKSKAAWLEQVNPSAGGDAEKAWSSFFERLQAGEESPVAKPLKLYATLYLRISTEGCIISLVQPEAQNMLSGAFVRKEGEWKLRPPTSTAALNSGFALLLDLAKPKSATDELARALDVKPAARFWDTWLSRFSNQRFPRVIFHLYKGAGGTRLLKLERLQESDFQVAFGAPMRARPEAASKDVSEGKKGKMPLWAAWILWLVLISLVLSGITLGIRPLIRWGRAIARRRWLPETRTGTERERELSGLVLDHAFAAAKRRLETVSGLQPVHRRILDETLEFAKVLARDAATSASAVVTSTQRRLLQMIEQDLLRKCGLDGLDEARLRQVHRITLSAVQSYHEADPTGRRTGSIQSLHEADARLLDQVTDWLGPGEGGCLWIARQMSAARQALLEKKQQIDDLSTEVSRLSREAQQAQRKTDALNETLNTRTAEKEELAIALSAARTEVSRLKGELDQANRRLATLASGQERTDQEFSLVDRLAGCIRRAQRLALTTFETEATAVVGYLSYYSLTQLLLAIGSGDERRERAMLANLTHMAERLRDASGAQLRDLSDAAEAIAKVDPDLARWMESAPKASGDPKDGSLFSRILERLRAIQGIDLAPLCYDTDKDGNLHIAA